MRKKLSKNNDFAIKCVNLHFSTFLTFSVVEIYVFFYVFHCWIACECALLT